MIERNPTIQKFIENVFPEETQNIKEGKCPFCGEKIKMDNFKDELSRKEFEISGMCQKCQDNIFD